MLESLEIIKIMIYSTFVLDPSGFGRGSEPETLNPSGFLLSVSRGFRGRLAALGSGCDENCADGWFRQALA